MFGKVKEVAVDSGGSTGLVYVLFEAPQHRKAAEVALNGSSHGSSGEKMVTSTIPEAKQARLWLEIWKRQKLWQATNNNLHLSARTCKQGQKRDALVASDTKKEEGAWLTSWSFGPAPQSAPKSAGPAQPAPTEKN